MTGLASTRYNVPRITFTKDLLRFLDTSFVSNLTLNKNIGPTMFVLLVLFLLVNKGDLLCNCDDQMYVTCVLTQNAL